MWKIGNQKLKKLQSQAWNRFLRFKASTKFDELNVLRSTTSLYKDLDVYCQKALYELASEVYKDVVKEYFGVIYDDDVATAWVGAILTKPNEITKYVYESEVLRKRDRFREMIVADGNNLRDLKRAYNAWIHQVEQYVIDVEKQATIKAYDDNGVQKVVWVTQDDERVCSDCEELNGQIFNIDDVPPQPHDNCRCYVIPYEEGDESND